MDEVQFIWMFKHLELSDVILRLKKGKKKKSICILY